MLKTVKGAPLRFFNNHSVAKFQKIEKQEMRILIVPKNLKKGTLWDFLTFGLLQDIEQREGWTLCRH